MKLAKWDDKPQYMYYHGETREFFLKSALAKALNRELPSIRSMERLGVLCTPPVVNKDGWYLYTRDQIEDLIELATQEGVINPKYRRPFSEQFIREANAICKRRP